MNARSLMEQTNELVRKTAKILKSKGVTLFEAFVHFDTNASGLISRLELNIGLKNLDIHLNEQDFTVLWCAFSKQANGRITFASFLNRFVSAGAMSVTKFDDTLEVLVKRFANTLHKLGDNEEAFRKLDKNGSGVVTQAEFREQCQRHSLGLLAEEVDLLYKAISNADSLNVSRKFEFTKMEDLEAPTSSTSRVGPKGFS